MHANAFAATASHIDFVERGLRDQIDVEAGYQSLLDRDVVVRRLHPHAAASPRKRSQFIKEIQTLASLHHHNFIRVYDAGLEDEIPFAVFERLRGTTVQHRLELLAARGAQMEVDEAVRIVQGVADGVEYALRRGVRVHDLTPQNITLTADQRVVLTSLGQPFPDNPLTAPAELIAYAPPERLFDGMLEDNSEVYSLGVLLAHLIVGRLPFEGDASAIFEQKQQSNSLPILEDARLSLCCPYPLATVMHRATTYQVSGRYPSVDMFRKDLLAVLNHSPRITRPLPARGQRLREPLSLEELYAAEPRLRGNRRISPVLRQRAAVREDTYDEPLVPESFDGTPPDPPITPRPVKAAPTPVAPPTPVAAPAVAAQPVPEVAPAEIAPPEPVAMVAPDEPETYDPLMPGLNNPALRAALPFTVLVPMPEQAETGGAGARGTVLRQNVLSAHHMAILFVLTILAITTAMMFG